MADEKFTFEQARIRLEEIAAEVRKKDTSLEKSLDLLEEGVRLANICTELVDHTDVSATVIAPQPEAVVPVTAAGEQAPESDAAPADEPAVEGGPDAAAAPATSVDAGDRDDADSFEDADDEVAEPADSGSDD